MKQSFPMIALLAGALLAGSCSKTKSATPSSSGTVAFSSAFPNGVSSMAGPVRLPSQFTASIGANGAMNVQIAAPPYPAQTNFQLKISGAKQTVSTGWYYPLSVNHYTNDTLVTTAQLGLHTATNGKSYYLLVIASNPVVQPGNYVDTL